MSVASAWYSIYNPANWNPPYESGSSLRGFELSGSVCMQSRTKGNGNLVRVNGVSIYPGFDLTGFILYLFACELTR